MEIKKLVSSKESQHIRDPEETLRRLTEAGRVVFGARGYGEATVDEIVERAGCSKGAFYNHFASKEELFLRLLETRLRINHQRVLELCPWQGNCTQWVKKVFETLVGFAAQDPCWRALSAEFMAHGMRNAHIGQRISHMHEEFRQIVSGTLHQSEAYRAGRVTVDADAVAACLAAMIDGLVIQASLESEQLPLDRLGRFLEPLLQAWFRGE